MPHEVTIWDKGGAEGGDQYPMELRRFAVTAAEIVLISPERYSYEKPTGAGTLGAGRSRKPDDKKPDDPPHATPLGAGRSKKSDD